ncbi:MAG: ParA family protein [Bacteroidales bacterium]|jgi:cellulose biosynthesis protein BcsQ|nr:ParA family protein [Bacteroidales bacterium]
MGQIFNPGLVVSFANQKGGVGKSTLTSIFANYLFTEGKKQGLNVAVIDADDRQQTLYRKRQREGGENVESYKIIQISSSDVKDNIEFLQDSYDIILLDLPGNMMQEGVITSYYMIDIYIIPFQPNEFDIDSTAQFYELLQNKIITIRKKLNYKTTVAAVMNRVKPQLLEFKQLYAQKSELPYSVLDSYIKDSSVAYQRNITTTGITEENEANTALCEEILETIINHIKDN